MAKQPVFKGVTHICVVVRNLEEAMKLYWETYGIGPWKIYVFDSSTVSNMVIRDAPMDHAFRLAETTIGDFRWELIEPLDDRCVYAEFLKEHGEGLHHVGFATDNYNEALGFVREKGIGVLQGGTWYGHTYAYLDSEGTLSFMAEISGPPDFEPPIPEATYP